MITGISITNFKGIRGIVNSDGELDPVEIELRPLTLLFGANSAGKSSILHALQYAAEVFERRNLDAGLIGDGAAGVDLGGFQNFVHGHNSNLDVTLGFKLAFSLPSSFPSFSTRTPRDVDDPSSLYGLPKSAFVSVTIGWSNLLSAPFVRKYAVKLDDVELAETDFEPGSPECELLLNERHPTFVRNGDHSALALWHPLEAEDLGEDTVIAQLLSWAVHTHAIQGLGPAEAPYTSRYGLLGLRDALPDCDRTLSFDADWDWVGRDPQNVVVLANELSPGEGEIDAEEMIRLLQGSTGKDWDSVRTNPRKLHDAIERLIGDERFRQKKNALNRLQQALLAGGSLPDLADYLREAVSQVVIGPGRLLRDLLVNSRFLGPIREVPQRNHTPSRQQERARWSSGLGAWDRLETSDAAFIDSVSHWLGDENRLNSGYRLRLKRFKELDLGDPLVVQLLTGRAFDDADIGAKLDLSSVPTQSRVLIVPVDGSIELRPNDVGIGISQVVPVIVTALDGAGQTIVVEQPELHLHPKLQAELADLFIEAAKGKAGHVVLLETHSELIPLRIMRRIRETFEQRKQERIGLAEEDVAIYYVEPFKGATVVTRLNLSERGQLLDPWPEGFFEEGYRERFSD